MRKIRYSNHYTIVCPYEKDKIFPKKVGSFLCMFNCRHFGGTENSNGNKHIYCLCDELLKENVNYKILLTEKIMNITFVIAKQKK